MADVQPLLTHHEVAEILGKSERWVRDLMNAGEIPFVRIGRTRRVRRADLDAYLERMAGR